MKQLLQTLYVYRHIQTHEIALSLRLPMRSPRPSLGRPLRKDHWLPVVHAKFSTPNQAHRVHDIMSVYRSRRRGIPALQKDPNSSVPCAVADLADALRFVSLPVYLSWASSDDRLYAQSWPEIAHHLPKPLLLKRGYRLK